MRIAFCLAICCVLLLAISALVEAGKPPPPPPPQITRQVTMSVREDYDKGDDLDWVDDDFALMNTLDVDEMVCSFGWDDLEPTKGNYDFTWLESFCTRAANYGVDLRPYICYAPSWAGDGNWNSPPTAYEDWYNFMYELGNTMESHSNVVSYEIWNEWNDSLWWNGTFTEYKTLLQNASNALDAAYTNDPVIQLGGLVWPHYEAIDACTTGTFEQYYEIVSFHCYSETWPTNTEVEGYLDAQYTDWFVPTVNNNGEGEPIWMNEIGYSTYGRTEADQAGFLARAVFYYFCSDDTLSEIDHYCCYEIKDLDPNKPAIGDEHNYHFGLTDYQRNEKAAFDTYDMLTDLFDDKTITPANDEITATATSGRFGDEFYYLVKRSDGSQLVCIYDKRNDLTAEVTVTDSESYCKMWNLDGTSLTLTTQTTPAYDGTDTISNISITGTDSDPDCIRIFELWS